MTANAPGVVLVLGASGTIGRHIRTAFAEAGATALGTSRRVGIEGLLAVDPYGPAGLDALDGVPLLDAVVWAQGSNMNDSVGDLDTAAHDGLLQANVGFVSATLARLLASGRIADGARLVVISSIWQQVARSGKYSYTVSKAALGGLVRSAAVDLASRGIFVNAVLPGVVDTEMTRGVLSEEQIEGVRHATGFGRLVTLADVAATVEWLCSRANTGVTGQSVAVDLGYSAVRSL